MQIYQQNKIVLRVQSQTGVLLFGWSYYRMNGLFILLILMEFSANTNATYNLKNRLRLLEIPKVERSGTAGKDGQPINADLDEYFSPWENQDNAKVLTSYLLHRKNKQAFSQPRVHSFSFSTSAKVQPLPGYPKKPRYHQKSLMERRNDLNNFKILKMASLDMQLDQEAIHTPQNKYGLNQLMGRDRAIRENQKQMPNRVKILKRTLLKFEDSQQGEKSKEKVMFTTLTEKVSRDLVADTLTINSAIVQRGYKGHMDRRNDKGGKEQRKGLPRLIQQKSIKAQKSKRNSTFLDRKIGLQAVTLKKQLKIKEFILRKDNDDSDQINYRSQSKGQITKSTK